MHFSKQILLTAVACLTPVLSQAAPVAVTSNPSMSIGNLNFSNFTCSISKGGAAVTPSNCGEIKVGTITDPGVGISFTSGYTAMSGESVAFDDAVLTYHVSSAAGISAVGLDFNGWFSGLAITSVTETIYDHNNNDKQVGFAKVGCGTFGDCVQSDSISLDGSYTNLFIKKDINVTAAGGIAQASYVDQTFTAAPEPGSTALLGGGLLALAGLIRRRFAKGAQQA